MCKMTDKIKELDKAQRDALLSYAELLANVVEAYKEKKRTFSVQKPSESNLTPAQG